jgi:leucyl aminopeptidase
MGVQIEILAKAPAQIPVLVLGAHEGRRLTPTAAAWDKRLRGALRRAMASGRFTGARDQHLDILAPVGLPQRRLLLAGLGTARTLKSAAAEEIGGRIENVLAQLEEAEAAVALDLPAGPTAHLALGAILGGQRFFKLRTRPRPEDVKPVLRLVLEVKAPAAAKREFARLAPVADGVGLARTLVNEPANLLGPEEFVRRARKLQSLGVKVEVLDERALKRLGMEALLAVGGGSARRPRLLVLRWKGRGAKAGRGPIAFVGKGVCFDAGGLSIKKAEGMEEMKGDMAGAAAVVGAIRALALRKAPVEAVGVAALVENLASSMAYRPGDVIRTHTGETVEIINTDAEGRVILADALAYTARRFKPRAMVDLATLTYAVGAALGHFHAGIMCNNEALARRLIAAGQETGDRLWRLPLGKEYDENLVSAIADLRQIAPDSDVADAVHGAQFLQHFVGDTPWAHLDIAYTGMFAPKERPTQPKGATGFGVRLLDAFAESYEG